MTQKALTAVAVLGIALGCAPLSKRPPRKKTVIPKVLSLNERGLWDATKTKGLTKGEKLWLQEFIVNPAYGFNANMTIGRYMETENPILLKEIKEVVGYGAEVEKLPGSGSKVIPKLDYRIIKTNYFPLKEPGEHFVYRERTKIPELTTIERTKLGAFIGLPPSKKGDSLTIFKRRFKPDIEQLIREQIDKVVAGKGIIFVSPCRKRYADVPRRCTAYSIFKGRPLSF